jgi:predicted transport protein
MPEHRLLAVLRIFEVDAVVVQVAPDFGGIEITVEIFEEWERIEKLLFRLIDEVDAVGIEHLAIALQHTHNLQQVVGRVDEQGFAGQQAAFHFLLIDREIGLNQILGNNRHLSSLLR